MFRGWDSLSKPDDRVPCVPGGAMTNSDSDKCFGGRVQPAAFFTIAAVGPRHANRCRIAPSRGPVPVGEMG